jgi:hypothetical protein
MTIRKVDANQAQIVSGLRQCGCFILHTHTLGHGIPDLFVWYAGAWTPLELKQPNGRLTDDERDWWDRLGQVPNIATDLESAAKHIGLKLQ